MKPVHETCYSLLPIFPFYFCFPPLCPKFHLLLFHPRHCSPSSFSLVRSGVPPPPAVRAPKGHSVCRVISLGWIWTLTPSPWCIPTTNPQTHSHNGHVWPHKRLVSLWSFLINLSLLFCHLLKSCLCWRSLSLCSCCSSCRLKKRQRCR